MHRYPELHAALSTPIPSVKIPFLKDGAIDFDGLNNFVDRVIENGARTLMLTYGDSLYTILTDGEVEEVTRAVVRHNNGRAKIIAADRCWWTGKTVEFARYCRDLGVDVLMVLPPDWGGSSTPETLVPHYRAVAEEIPVMMVTGLFGARGEAFGLDVVRRVYDEVENVVAVKDDVCESFGRQLAAMVCDRWTMIAGGTKQIHLYLAPYGCQGHLSTLIIYKPEIAHQYWQLIQSRDYTAASEIVNRYDIPLFDLLSRFNGGFDAGLHAWGEIVGIYQRWRRSPYDSLHDDELEGLKMGLHSLGLL